MNWMTTSFQWRPLCSGCRCHSLPKKNVTYLLQSYIISKVNIVLFSFFAVLFLEVFGLLGFGDVCEGMWCGMFILYGYGMLLRFCEVWVRWLLLRWCVVRFLVWGVRVWGVKVQMWHVYRLPITPENSLNKAPRLQCFEQEALRATGAPNIYLYI